MRGAAAQGQITASSFLMYYFYCRAFKASGVRRARLALKPPVNPHDGTIGAGACCSCTSTIRSWTDYGCRDQRS